MIQSIAPSIVACVDPCRLGKASRRAVKAEPSGGFVAETPGTIKGSSTLCEKIHAFKSTPQVLVVLVAIIWLIVDADPAIETRK